MLVTQTPQGPIYHVRRTALLAGTDTINRSLRSSPIQKGNLARTAGTPPVPDTQRLRSPFRANNIVMDGVFGNGDFDRSIQCHERKVRQVDLMDLSESAAVD